MTAFCSAQRGVVVLSRAWFVCALSAGMAGARDRSLANGGAGPKTGRLCSGNQPDPRLVHAGIKQNKVVCNWRWPLCFLMLSARCFLRCSSCKGDKGPLSFDDLFGDEMRDVFAEAASSLRSSFVWAIASRWIVRR